jgi:hypothetical protein
VAAIRYFWERRWSFHIHHATTAAGDAAIAMNSINAVASVMVTGPS